MKIIDEIRRYGCWAGRPNGTPEDPTRCVKEIHTGERGMGFRQCSRKRGYGPNNLYCKIHVPATLEAKRKAQDEAIERKIKLNNLDWDIKSARYNVSELARKAFIQEASFDDLETAVNKLNKLLEEKEAISS